VLEGGRRHRYERVGIRRMLEIRGRRWLDRTWFDSRFDSRGLGSHRFGPAIFGPIGSGPRFFTPRAFRVELCRGLRVFDEQRKLTLAIFGRLRNTRGVREQADPGQSPTEHHE